MEKYVIGIDGGTESLRASIFDLKGNQIANAAAPYPTHFPRPSWAEQDPLDWIEVRRAACIRIVFGCVVVLV